MLNFSIARCSLPVWGIPSYGYFFGGLVKAYNNPGTNFLTSRSYSFGNSIYDRSVSKPSFDKLGLYGGYGHFFGYSVNYPFESTVYLPPATGQFVGTSISSRMVSNLIESNESLDGYLNSINRCFNPIDINSEIRELQIDKECDMNCTGVGYKLKSREESIGEKSELLEKVRRSNVEAMNEWLPHAEKIKPPGWLVREPVNEILKLNWDNIPEYEQILLVDGIRKCLVELPEKIKENHDFSVECVKKYLLREYSSFFQKYSPNTSCWLREVNAETFFDFNVDCKWALFGCHLTDFLNNFSNKFFGSSAADELSYRENSMTIEQLKIWESYKSLLCIKGISERYTELLTRSPLELGIKESQQLARDLLKDIKAAKENTPLPIAEELVGIHKAMKNDMFFQEEKLIEFIEQLEINGESSPLSHEKWQEVKGRELHVAVAVIDRKLNEMKVKGLEKYKKRNRLKELRERLLKELKYVEQGIDGYDYSVERDGKKGLYTDEYVSSLKKLLFKTGVKKDINDIERLQNRERAVVLKKGWKPIFKRLSVVTDGKIGFYSSNILPASSLFLCPEFGLERGSSKKPALFYEKGEGVPSLCKSDMIHAVNLNETHFYRGKYRRSKSEDALFKGLRSGTIGPAAIERKCERKLAAAQRARELLVAALRLELDNNPEKWAQVISKKPVSLRLASNSLLSTDTFRNSHLIKSFVKHGVELGLQDNELLMQREQVEAIENIKKELDSGGELVIRDTVGVNHSVKVRLETAHFNFGVNALSLKNRFERENNYGKKGESKWFMGLKPYAWHEAPKYNIKALKILVGDFENEKQWEVGGWAREFLEGSRATDKDKSIVRQLSEQIRKLYLTGDYKTEGEDAYKMVSRILLLSYKIGAIPHFNCKSGKDRTGEADASVKRLAAEIDALGYVPDPWEPISHEDQLRSQMFAWNSGNMENIIINANAPGYKIETGMNRLGVKVWEKVRFQCKPSFESIKQPIDKLRGIFAPAA